MFKFNFFIVLFVVFFLMTQCSYSQKSTESVFKTIKQLKTTPVKNQSKSGTCWSFAVTSFLESELMRMGKGEYDISEMFFVRHAYIQKAISYVRLHGLANFAQGGQAHDIINVLREYGMVPETAYSVIKYDKIKYDHDEVEAVLKGMLTAIAKRDKISPVWQNAVESVLDAYFDKVPANFDYNGKNYTPISFAKESGLNPDDYIELTSFTHHPFYKQCRLEVPDNWSFSYYYNLPIDELITVMDYAIDNGYTIAWDGDVSEKTFSSKKDFAKFFASDADTSGKEQTVTMDMRQKSFDNFSTTDDHLMHIIGIANDSNKTKYYITKNSWGTTAHINGYVNLSEQFVRAKTVAILIHKDAIPVDIAKKIGIK